MSVSEQELLKRWRLVLGADADQAGAPPPRLSADENRMDQALEALYGQEPTGGGRRGGLGGSAPKVSRWLGDLRSLFPSSVVKVVQKDAIDRLGLTKLLTEPEMLDGMEPNVHLAASLVNLRGQIPESTKAAARQIVAALVEDVQRRLSEPLRQAVMGSINRSVKNRRPRHAEIDWAKTIRKNLHTYDPERKTIIPERLVGYGRKKSALKEIVLCIDQSGSMMTSVVYASIFGAVLASLPAVKVKMVVFDTEVVDLTDDLKDPVEVLFGLQLGGGTDINKAVGYCETLIDRPDDTVMILISDLYEGGDGPSMLRRCERLVQRGVNLIALLALNDDGHPAFDHRMAETMTGFGVPSFACTPDRFPDLIAHALQRIPLDAFLPQDTSSQSAKAA